MLLTAGVEWEVVTQPKCYGATGFRTLERLVRNSPQDCWILLYSNGKMQRWFSANRVPCLLVNAGYAGVDLPDLDNDHRATARHAAGRLLRLGHRRIALVTEGSQRGDLMDAEAGFREAFTGRTAPPDAEPIVARYREFTVPEVVRSLETLFRRTRRPTALVVTNSQAYPLTLCFLAQRGLRIPRDVSLLATTDDTLYSHLLPPPTHYRSMAPEAVAKVIYRMVRRIARGEKLARPKVRLTTTCVAGGSIQGV